MPRFEITAPDGRRFEITAPEGATQDEVLAYAQANYQSIPAPKESTIGSELVRGGKQVYSSARTGLESIFNPEEAAKAGVARSEAIAKEAGEGPSFEAVKNAYDKNGILSAAGEAVSQIPRALAGQGANLASMYAAGKAGAAAGAPLGIRGRVIGGAAGAASALLPQFMGSNVERQAAEQMEEGKDVDINRTKAYTAAAGQAALEGAGTAFTLGKKVLGGVLGITETAALRTAKAQAELVKAAERSLAASAGRGAIRGTAELPVEVGQQILERYQAGLDLTSPEAIKEYGESAYQALLIGAPLGASGNVLERGQAKAEIAQQKAAEAAAQAQRQREIVPGAQLPPEAPAGTQGALFTEEEMGKVVKPPKEAPAPAVSTYTDLTEERDRLRAQEQTPEIRAQLDAVEKQLTVPQGEQLGLGLDFERDYPDIVKERERLKTLPKTPEVKARIAELDKLALGLHEQEIASIRGEKQAQAELQEQFPGLSAEPAQQGLFPELDVVRPTPAEPAQPKALTLAQEEARRRLQEAQDQADAEAAQKEQERKGGQYRLPLRTVPEGKEVKRTLPIPARPDEITMQDLEDIGVPLRSAKTWLEQNVIGKTPAEIRVLVGLNPDLLLEKGSRAQILKYLTAPVPEGFKEEPSGTTPTQTNKPKRESQPRGGESGVGVFGEPTSTDVVQPGAGVPAAPTTPTTPNGLGLAPAGQPVSTGTTAQGTTPTAVTTPAVTTKNRTSDQVMDEMRELKKEQEALLTSAGKRPAVNSKARARWDEITDLLAQKMAEWTELDRAERKAKGTNAPTTTATTPSAPAATTTAEGPKTTAGAAPAATTTTTAETPAATSAPKAVNPFAGLMQGAGTAETTVEEETPKPAARRSPLDITGPSLFGAELQTKAEETREGKAARRAAEAAEAAKKAAEEKKAKETQKAADDAKKAATEAKKAAEEAKKAEEARKAAEEARKAEEAKKAEEERKAAKAKKAEEERKAEEAKKAEEERKAEEAKKAVTAKTFYNKVEVEPTWSKQYGGLLTPIVYEDADFALVRKLNRVKEVRYYALNRNGSEATYPITLMDKQPTWLSDKQIEKLRDAATALELKETELAKDNPDGPFANRNVVAADNAGANVEGYTRNLLQSLGLNDLRIFIFKRPEPKEVGYVDKYKLYGKFGKLAEEQRSELNGSAIKVGTDGKTYGIYLSPTMSEGKTLEVLAHEIGHIVQVHLYDNATTAEQKAITDEYLAWRKKAKLSTKRELMQMLRNREDAEYNIAIAEKRGDADMPASTMQEFESYWLSFGEWFADNVSRWATTNEKPLSIADKFFSKVAQKMRDLVAIITGRKYPPAKSVADFLNAAGPANFTPQPNVSLANNNLSAEQFSVSFGTEQLIDSIGPLEAEKKSGFTKLVDAFRATPEIDYTTKFRTQVTDIAATIEQRLQKKFDGAVRNSLGELNPMGLYRQAQDYTKMLLEYFQTGTLYKDSVTGLWKSGVGKGVRPPAEVYDLINKYADKNGYTRERATQIASRVLEGVRLNEMRKSNKTGMTNFAIHLKDNEIDQLVQEYNADPDLRAMSALMDEARIAMVDNLVKVGRLTKEMGDEWKSVIGYVPFDRIDDFATNFSKAKKISGKGIAQLGKLPELIGSETRMVGNVFDNYINTLGWMVGQTLNTDATVQTLRSLESEGFAKKLHIGMKPTAKSVGAYVNGEMQYWELPSKYDVMAFKDLNPPKAGWLRAMGAFSNVLRKTVTVLPPFALKQVTDDVQRAILTSGVRNPGALVWMSLTNFPKLALAELRGIQHPVVKEFGRLGLTGEYDFEAGKPATSLLKDLGYVKRTAFKELLHRLDGITRASDLAVRKAIYDQTINETNDELLAQTRAREFINFRRRGASDFVGAMVTTIPFFNAYIQGMDVLYRAASGKDSSASVDRAQARQLFWSRAATVFMLSSLYALGKDDEDKDYKEMDLRTRDGNWILGGGYKIGVPGELGALFKVIPERIVEYMKRQGTPEEQTAWEATRTTLSYMYEQYLGRAMPVPQAIKPVMEAWANKSFLTGRDLEGYHHKAMDPSMRVTEQTSELAKAIAVFSRDQIGVEVSPIMIDNSLRGYFGSSAAMFTMVTDSLINPTRIDRPLHKYALLSNYMYDPVGTRRMTEFYEEREKVGKANTTLKELMKTDLARAEKYAEEHSDELQMERAVNSTLEQLERTRAYRKYLNSPDGAADMSREDREAALKEVKQMELEMVAWVREAKTEMRKVQ
jgi:hypothetical protein